MDGQLPPVRIPADDADITMTQSGTLGGTSNTGPSVIPPLRYAGSISPTGAGKILGDSEKNASARSFPGRK